MSQNNYDAILSTIKKAAIEAGNLAKNSKDSDRVNIFGIGDVVTKIDIAAEKLIRSILESEYPDLTIFSEEDHKSALVSVRPDLSKFTGFLVDPIDGSVNFSRTISQKYGHYAISIGYAEEGQVKVGAIYKPLENEMFHAIQGEGAFQDGEKIHVSEIDVLRVASIEVGSYWIRDDVELFRRWFTNNETDVSQILIRGSAAAGLADVARGRIEAMLHSHLNAWDYAAGWVIVEEAGGVVMDGDCTKLTLGSRFMYATNAKLNDDIKRILTLQN